MQIIFSLDIIITITNSFSNYCVINNYGSEINANIQCTDFGGGVNASLIKVDTSSLLDVFDELGFSADGVNKSLVLPSASVDFRVGVAGGIGEGLIIRKGEVVRKVPEADLLSELRKEIYSVMEEYGYTE